MRCVAWENPGTCGSQHLSLMTPTAQGGLLCWCACFQQGKSTTATELWHRWKVLGPETKSFLRKAACEESRMESGEKLARRREQGSVGSRRGPGKAQRPQDSTF